MECTSRSGERFSSERLVQLISAGRRKSLKDVMESIREEIMQWRGAEPFADDVSLLGAGEGVEVTSKGKVTLKVVPSPLFRRGVPRICWARMFTIRRPRDPGLR